MASTTNNPKIISYNFNRVFRKSGWMSAIKNEHDAKQQSVTEILDILIASKNVAQCAAVINPTNNICHLYRHNTISFLFLTNNTITSVIKAINILSKTIEEDGIFMSLPKIPVKPQIITVKWSIR